MTLRSSVDVSGNTAGPSSRKEKTMEHRRTILYIFDRSNCNNSVLAAIKETGYEVLSTDSPTQGVALLYVLGQVSAVVLDCQVKKHANFDVAESLRKILPEVPVILKCCDQIHSSLSLTESCVNTDELPAVLQHLLNEVWKVPG
jgi:DNA-binding NtrC family response regulator